MSKRMNLFLTDAAAAILTDRARIPYGERGAWVSEAIIRYAAGEDAEQQDTVKVKIAELERELTELKAKIKD